MSTIVQSVEDIKLNNFHHLLSVRSGGGSFVDGYVLSIIGVGMLQITSALQLTNFWQGMVAASALIGIFFGGFVGGWITGKFGRQKPYFIGPTLFIICSIGQFWVQSGYTLFIYRFLIGIAVGIEYPVATALLVEFLPKKSRGPLLAMLTIMWFAGAAVAYIVGDMILRAGGEDAWRYILASTAVIGMLLFLIRLGTPESPRWLIAQGKIEEAEKVIKKVYGEEYSLDHLPEQPAEQKISFLNLLHSGYGKRMFFVSTFWTCSVIPVFAVYAFAPKVLLALNLKGEWASFGSIAITFLFVVGCIIATQLINVMGRRPMLIYSFLLSGIALFLLGMFYNSSEIVILILFGAYAVFIGGAQVLQLVYPNEIFPTEIRATAVGIGTSLSRIGAAIGTYLVPMSLDQFGISDTMYAAAAVTFFGLLVSYCIAPETKHLNLNEAGILN